MTLSPHFSCHQQLKVFTYLVRYLNIYWMDWTFLGPRRVLMSVLMILTFHLAPLSVQNFNLSLYFGFDQIPSKLTTFPSTSAVLCF